MLLNSGARASAHMHSTDTLSARTTLSDQPSSRLSAVTAKAQSQSTYVLHCTASVTQSPHMCVATQYNCVVVQQNPSLVQVHDPRVDHVGVAEVSGVTSTLARQRQQAARERLVQPVVSHSGRVGRVGIQSDSRSSGALHIAQQRVAHMPAPGLARSLLPTCRPECLRHSQARQWQQWSLHHALLLLLLLNTAAVLAPVVPVVCQPP